MAAKSCDEEVFLKPPLGTVEKKAATVSPEMCCFCFDVLIGHLNGGYSLKTSYRIPNEE